MNAGNALDEFKIACEFIRSLAALRFLRLTILFGATGGLIGAMMSDKVQADPKLLLLLRTAGLGVTIAFGMMDYTSSAALRRVRDRANELAASLQLSDATVKTHVARILSKLSLRDRAQAIVVAYETGLVTPGSRVD